MAIDHVQIDCDEDGFHLILDVESLAAVERWRIVDRGYRLDLPLGQDAALELRSEVKEKIEEWAATRDEVEADFKTYLRTGVKPDYVLDNDDDPLRTEEP